MKRKWWIIRCKELWSKKAQGKYISFVDSDDYVNIKLYKELKEYMNQGYDLVKFKIIKVDEKCKELEKTIALYLIIKVEKRLIIFYIVMIK